MLDVGGAPEFVKPDPRPTKPMRRRSEACRRRNCGSPQSHGLPPWPPELCDPIDYRHSIRPHGR
jgi:hypothetical protein